MHWGALLRYSKYLGKLCLCWSRPTETCVVRVGSLLSVTVRRYWLASRLALALDVSRRYSIEMASKAPKWPRKADEQAQWLRSVIEPAEEIDDEGCRFLEKGLASKSGHVVATAAAIVARRRVVALAPAMAETFVRLLDDGAKRDPQCRAKIAIAKALADFDGDPEATLRRGLVVVQTEAIWGGSVDTAAPLRAACAKALVALRIPDLMARLTDLLADPEPAARIGAVHAMVEARRREASYPLRLLAALPDPSVEVVGACFEGVLALDDDEGVTFVAARLHHVDHALSDQAVLALGHCRRPDALLPLLDWLRNPPIGRDTSVGLTAVVAHRSESGLAFLFERLATADETEALSVAEALGPMAFDPRVVERVRAAVADRSESRLRQCIDERFAAGSDAS